MKKEKRKICIMTKYWIKEIDGEGLTSESINTILNKLKINKIKAVIIGNYK